MARYRGRHRRPTDTARRLTRIALAGSVAGAPLLAVLVPGTASAASDKTWDRLAECEASGDWSANTGNGYYGGLQFSSSTWRAFDGDEFASRADLASRAEQIIVAERVLEGQGWNAWPTCSRKVGARSEGSTPRDTPPPPTESLPAAPAPLPPAAPKPAPAPVLPLDPDQWPGLPIPDLLPINSLPLSASPR